MIVSFHKKIQQRNTFRVVFITLAIVALCAVVSGCKKFLDVTPRDKVPQSILLKDEQGFKDALTGVYLGMDKPTTGGTFQGLYTSDLSMGMLATLGYDYDNATTANAGANSNFFNSAVYYFYTDATMRAETDAAWMGMYNNIANLNNILEQIDAKKSLFTADNYNRIKGEAIGLRALFHFDLLRLFGQPPLTGMNSKAIPYITSYGITSTPFSTLQNGLDSCISDLSAAKELLSHTDTLSVLKATDDPFRSYTQNHMNYWAVQALMARVYLYKGDVTNADLYATVVINSNKFPLVSSNIAAAANPVRDRLFSQEHVFSIYSANVKNYNSALFNKSSGVPLLLTAAGKNRIYTTGSGSSSDYRYISWFDNSVGGSNVPSKFFQDANLPYSLQNIVPVIRASEMYYIAAESVNSKGDIGQAVWYLNQVRQARGLAALNASGIASTDSLSKEIMKEYQKEFIQEGQTFFYYKRLNKDLKQVTATTATIPADVYVLPIPDKEREYNH
ncbi:MAG: RagB/SusD family nutrient uptake outer membrane protein [Flavisolibacter sp.]